MKKVYDDTSHSRHGRGVYESEARDRHVVLLEEASKDVESACHHTHTHTINTYLSCVLFLTPSQTQKREETKQKRAERERGTITNPNFLAKPYSFSISSLFSHS